LCATRIAARRISPAGGSTATAPVRARTADVAALRAMAPAAVTGTASLAGTDAVHLVASTARVRSLAASDPSTYDGYLVAVHAATGRLLYACLGATCPTIG
jgi:hypothetical protein